MSSRPPWQLQVQAIWLCCPRKARTEPQITHRHTTRNKLCNCCLSLTPCVSQRQVRTNQSIVMRNSAALNTKAGLMCEPDTTSCHDWHNNTAVEHYDWFKTHAVSLQRSMQQAQPAITAQSPQGGPKQPQELRPHPNQHTLHPSNIQTTHS